MIEFLTRGLYTVPEAGRILREQNATIRRWAFGYRRRGQTYPSAIRTDVPTLDSTELLTFIELVELLSIRSILDEGLSWPKMREAAAVASRLLAHEDHPFARREWFVDPAGLYLKLGRAHEADLLIEVAGDAQVAMEEALRPYLHQLRFDRAGLADLWHPLGQEQPIVLDPRRALGAPIVEDGGIRTDVIYDLHLAGDGIDLISAYLELEEHEVRAAIAFEEALAA